MLAISIVHKYNYPYKNVYPLVSKDKQLLASPETHILKTKSDLFVNDCIRATNFHLCSDLLVNRCNLETAKLFNRKC